MSELDRALHASVLKREAEKERAFREERARLEEEQAQLGFGGTEMSVAELRKIVDSDRRMYYRTEEINDKLYIHYKGWKKIENLEKWTGLRALYAECNAFDKICGLHNCRSLRSLFLQENCIKKIEGLDNCPDLWNLNLSNNFIERIEGLSNLKNLNTFIIAKNKIGHRGLEDVEELVASPVVTLDIQDNQIWDPDVLPEVLVHMRDLRVLYMKGNPCAKKIPNYRKSTTVYCKELRYLDDRPVFDEDRRAAEAFNRGGLEEERAERKRIREEKTAAHDRNMKAFQEMIERVKLEKRERDAMRLEDKWTEAQDPGLYKERLMKQRHEAWEREHADELRDHDRERAERILQQEKEANGGKLPEDTISEEDKAKIEAEKKKFEEENKEEFKEDTRKLVYEDIWDDVPPARSPPQHSFQPPARATSSTANAPTATASAASVAAAAASTPDSAPAVSRADVAAAASTEVPGFVPAAAFQGFKAGKVFKLGSAGLGYYPDSQATSRSSSPSSASVPQTAAAAAAAQRSSGWYANYNQKMKAGVERLERDIESNKAAKVFAPPPRRETPAPPETPAPDLVADAEATKSSRPPPRAEDPNSELQEMD